MTKPVLYHGAPNGPSLSVLAMTFETGVDVELRAIDLLAGERHTIPALTQTVARDMGVEGEGPVLVVDGEAMTESVFLSQYLDELTGSGLQPTDAYAHWEMLMWCRRITERCAPAAAFLGNRAFSQSRLAAMSDADFGALNASIHSDDLRARWSDLRGGVFDDAQVTDSIQKVKDAAQMTEDKLSDGRDFLMGEFTIADLETYAWLSGMADVVAEAFTDKPHTIAWMKRIGARPSVQAALALAGGGNPRQSWAPGPEINRWG